MCKDNTIIWTIILIYIFFTCKSNNSNASGNSSNNIFDFTTSGIPI